MGLVCGWSTGRKSEMFNGNDVVQVSPWLLTKMVCHLELRRDGMCCLFRAHFFVSRPNLAHLDLNKCWEVKSKFE